MKVRLSTFYLTDEDLLRDFSLRYLAGGRTWKDITFVDNNDFDRLVILTNPSVETLKLGYDEKKALTFMTEPSISVAVQPHPTDAIMDFHLPLPFFPKGFNIHQQLSNLASNINIKKTKALSAVISELSGLPGHRARVSFVHIIDQVFESGLSLYGRPYDGRFYNILKNYEGSLVEKYDGMWDYAYHFTCENSFEKGYFTENIVDPIITECLCFYDGCPNIESFIDPRSYVRVDVNSVENSIGVIVECIQSGEYKKRLPFIKRQKRRFLTEMHPANIIRAAVHGKDLSNMFLKKD